MHLNKKENEPGLFKGVFLAFTILALHILLIAAVGVLVVFFQGIVKYLPWILIGGLLSSAACIYFLFKRLKAEGKTLKEILKSPLLGGRSVEVSFLGGVASVKIGESKSSTMHFLENREKPVVQLEDPETMKVREVMELAKLLDKNLITPEEYQQAKEKLLGNA